MDNNDDVLRDTVDSLCGYMVPDDGTTSDDDISSYVKPCMPSVLASLRQKQKWSDDDVVVGGGRLLRAGGNNNNDGKQQQKAKASSNPQLFAWLPWPLSPMASMGGLYPYGINEDTFNNDKNPSPPTTTRPPPPLWTTSKNSWTIPINSSKTWPNPSPNFEAWRRNYYDRSPS